MTQAVQRAVPYHMMPCSVYKVELAGGEIPVLRNEQVISVVGGEQLHCAKLVLYILLVVALLLLL